MPFILKRPTITNTKLQLLDKNIIFYIITNTLHCIKQYSIRPTKYKKNLQYQQVSL